MLYTKVVDEVNVLVSSIAQFDAVNRRNNAAFAAMQTMNTMSSTLKHGHAFSGEHSLEMLHQMDNRLSLDLISNALLYKIACLEEKMLAKMQANEYKNAQRSLDYIV